MMGDTCMLVKHFGQSQLLLILKIQFRTCMQTDTDLHNQYILNV